MDISMDRAKALLDSGIAEAQELIKEPSKVDDLLIQLEETLREVPKIGETLADLSLMVSMIKGYITREYSQVSPKVIVTMVAAILYLVRKKDIIPDKVPVVGMADDMAVLALALNLVKPELDEYKAFRDARRGQMQAAEEPAAEETMAESAEELAAEETMAEPAAETMAEA